MNPLTILLMLLLAAALALWNQARYVSLMLAGAVFAGGLAKMLGLLGLDLPLDQLLFVDRLNDDSGFVNRMSYLTALCFMAVGLSLLLARARPAHAQMLIGLMAVLSYLTFVAYFFGVNRNTQIIQFTPMAMNTALAFLLAGAGVLSISNDYGFSRLFLSRLGGGYLLSRAIPAVLIVPLLLGWLRVQGEEAGLFRFEYGAALMVVVTVAAIGTMLFYCARQIERMDEVITRQVGELRELNAEMESFSYSVSHDLRAPLRSMAGFSQLILDADKDKLSESSREMLERVARASARMGRLIDGLLNLSRMSRKDPRPAHISLSTQADRILRQMCESEPERKVDVKVQPNIEVYADEQLMETVMQNLIGNAWKFTGKVSDAQIEVGLTESDGAPSIFVRDNGAGFEMKYASKLFGAFQRLHSDSEFEGTGIGLATVRRVIVKHGGKIWAESQPNQGATFYFTLGLEEAK